MSRDRGLRQSQVITPHGVGAILDIGKESFVVADISSWKLDRSVRTLELRRLSKLLGKQLKTPPKIPPNTYGNQDRRKGIQLHRFPRTLLCELPQDTVLENYDGRRRRAEMPGLQFETAPGSNAFCDGVRERTSL